MTSVAFARYLKLCLLILLIYSFSAPYTYGIGVSDTLWLVNFDHELPADWWGVSTDTDVAWKRVDAPLSPASGAHLLLENAGNSFENLAILTAGSVPVLPDGDPLYLSLDLDCSLTGTDSRLLIEGWTGTSWEVLLKQTESMTGQWVYRIDTYLHPDFQLKFVYQSGPNASDRIQINHVLISRPASTCDNGVCEWGEDPDNCPFDCPRLPAPGTYWVPLGEDLSGKPVNYRAFKGRTACDDCSEQIDLPFAFDFYDEAYGEVYLNANGNLTLGAPLYEFTPSPFCLEGPKMIAPLFADVDLGRCGQIDYYLTDHYLLVTWSEVCHFRGTDTPTGLTNTFQLLITDGSVSAIRGIPLPEGTTILAAYGDMQWTTGNASGGSSGFSGVAATVGLNAGDGIRCYQYARFDHTGYDRVTHDSAPARSAGIDHLDYRYLAFNGKYAAQISQEAAIRLSGESSGGANAYVVNWITETESFLSLSLERAGDEGVFADVAQLTPSATGTFQDPLPLTSSHTYRIRMLLPDGQIVFSNTVRLQREEAMTLRVNASPNPFSDQIGVIVTAADPETEVLVRLADVQGHVLLQESIPAGGAANRIEWSTAGLAAGMYWLSVQQGADRLVQMVVKR